MRVNAIFGERQLQLKKKDSFLHSKTKKQEPFCTHTSHKPRFQALKTQWWSKDSLFSENGLQ